MLVNLIIVAAILFSLIYLINNSLTKEIRSHIFGFSMYYILFSLIFLIIFNTDFGLSAVNDYFTSVLLIIGLLISLAIYLTNRNIIASNKIIDFINKIPDYIPFSHVFKNYLLSLIKINYKIIILFKIPDDKNYIWILNQIAAYSNIFDNEDIDVNLKESIDFIFVGDEPHEIENLFSKFKIDRSIYIVITSLSSLFKNAIEAREKIIKDKKSVKIIGALSSASSENINKIINSDENIIRVFPPDYDEANTAINFIFYRIISTTCVSKICDFHNTKSNIIILHSGTYGSAISNRTQELFNSEINGLKYFTNSAIDNNILRENINYYSFNFIDNNFINDKTQNRDFDEIIKSTKMDENYFYIVGYEPNISLILEKLNTILEKRKCNNNYFLFCGTCSMYSWRKSIIDKIESLNCIKNIEQYYLKLKFYNSEESAKNSIVNCGLKFKYRDKLLMLNEVIRDISKLDINLNRYCQLDKNYISILTQQSIDIANEIINNPNNRLLDAKYSVLSRDNNTNILVNGDSINQYEIKKMEI